MFPFHHCFPDLIVGAFGAGKVVVYRYVLLYAYIKILPLSLTDGVGEKID